MLTAPASLVLLRPRAPCSPRVMERGCSGGLTGASARRFAPASASRREAGEGEMLGNEALRDALAAATQAAAEARAAADAARTAAAQADSAAERASKLLAAALSLQSPPLLQSTRVLPRRIIIVRHGESQARGTALAHPHPHASGCTPDNIMHALLTTRLLACARRATWTRLCTAACRTPR